MLRRSMARLTPPSRLRQIAAVRGEAPPLRAWRPSFNPWLIAVSVMLATFMEVLDTSVANVSLPHIAGSLAASTDEATWVLTSYLVSNAIVLPSTGWITSRFGRRKTLLTCIGIFTLASVVCGAATSLPMLIVARIVQGAGGGALQPIAQAVLLESFPPEQRGPAMAAYGMGVVVAPIIGPTLGGWITDNYSWRWVFYINLPIGVLAVLMCNLFVEDPPYLRSLGKIRFDSIGFGLMAVGLGAMQIMLDKGEEEDWLASNFIRWLLVLTVIGLCGFILRELLTEQPLVDLRIFRDRNFATGTVMITIVGGILYAQTAMIPLFLQTLVGYPALNSGLAVSPRGIGSFISTLIVGRLITRFDTRLLLLIGFGTLAYATWIFAGIDLQISSWSIAGPNIISGFAFGFLFVPLTTTTMGTLENEQVRNATGIYNLMRNIGGSVGISAATSQITRGAQRRQAYFATHLGPTSHVFQQQVHQLTAHLSGIVGEANARARAYALVYQTVVEQAQLAAYVRIFQILTLLSIACVVGLLCFQKVKPKAGAVAAD
jgi:MFS transporter, DHA2 family, multidrug resistance protein